MLDVQWRSALSVGSSDCANCRSPSVSWSETFPQRTALSGKHTHVKNIKIVLMTRTGFHGQRSSISSVFLYCSLRCVYTGGGLQRQSNWKSFTLTESQRDSG